MTVSQIFIGIFAAVFVGALAYELLNRTKPELTEKVEAKFGQGLDRMLKLSAAKA